MGVSVQHHPFPRKGPVPIVLEAGWASELIWMQRLGEESFASAGDPTPVIQSVVRHYTDWATSVPTKLIVLKICFLNQDSTNHRYRVIMELERFIVVLVFSSLKLSLFMYYKFLETMRCTCDNIQLLEKCRLLWLACDNLILITDSLNVQYRGFLSSFWFYFCWDTSALCGLS
jgi:hypothetical protein